ETMMHSLDSGYKVLTGSSDCVSLTAGHKFTLAGHPTGSMNGEYMVTSIRHEAEQNPTYVTDDEVEEPYMSSFSCIPHGAGAPPYCPPRKTGRPVIQGTQTATVVGPEEIFTDKYGRVKVQFHWDREGQNDSDSSCWVRVAQLWASNGWGSMFIPRVGMEVVVHFLDGDPDRPIITGCVYNPETMPAYTLPDEKTKSGVKSNSSTGGGGFNEFRIEDKKGEEQIFIHAEKDIDIRVKNDAKEIVLNDRHLKIENNQHEEVSRDKHLKVGGDLNEEVTGTVSLTTQNLQQKIRQSYALDATQEAHVKGGLNVVVESNTSLTMKVGGTFININSGGIFIKGTMVMINSGGAAGSGAGASPASPEEPLEADDAVAGSEVRAPRSSPPPPPKNYTALGTALAGASQSGTPFVG
ncbi:MAG: type VI secretion system Vgr family protein, partial [Phycisphaerae bacterium]